VAGLVRKDRLGKRGSDWFGDRADYSGALSTAASGSLSCGYSLNSFARCDRAGKKSSIQNRNGYHSTLVLKQFALNSKQTFLQFRRPLFPPHLALSRLTNARRTLSSITRCEKLNDFINFAECPSQKGRTLSMLGGLDVSGSAVSKVPRLVGIIINICLA
jgi:hypothetical protein